MSYLVLARKWRPQNFAEVVGQQAVVRTLRNALVRNRVPHALLFSGVRGVGKTTLARLMAKALNCREGAPDEPCNQCESCLSIMAGNALDLHEIDGASNRGIDEIRELKENVRFFPSQGRYKIFIIDEVHMLTDQAFNALLKTLEEPPAHVYFMFATTELHKIPITILSRCQRYELKRVPFAELVSFFAKVAEKEGVAISGHALEMIAREADGSVRDGLSLLDQIFSFAGEEISDKDVSQVLGLVDRQVYEKLARALLAGNLGESLNIFSRCQATGMDLKRFANDLLAFFRALLITGLGSEADELLDVSDQELAALKEIAAVTTRETVYQYFSLLLKGVEEMQHSSRPGMALEMAFVRAAQAGGVVPAAELLGRLDSLLAGVAPLPAPGLASPMIFTTEPGPVLPVAPVVAPVPEAPPDNEPPLPRVEPAKDTASGAVASSRHAEVREVKKHWDEFVEQVKKKKRWMGLALKCCLPALGDDGHELILKFDQPAECKMLQEPEHLKLLQTMALDFFQREFRIIFKVHGAALSGEGQADGAEALLAERRALANDPLVQMTAEIFNAQVGNVRIGAK